MAKQKEAKLFGNLFTTHPDIAPIIKAIKDKYNLPEISPDDDPIEEIYLEDEIIPLENFRKEIKELVIKYIDIIFPEQFAKIYKSSRGLSQTNEITDIEKLPEELRPTIETFFRIAQANAKPMFTLLDNQLESITNHIYINLLTGENEEIPEDWFGKVSQINMSGEPVILAMASELTDLDLLFREIRAEHKKLFGVRNVKVTDKMVSTAYYLNLKRAKIPWKTIVEEYIRRNVSMPKDRNSARYAEIWRKNEAKLKKRIQRTEKILDVIIRDRN